MSSKRMFLNKFVICVVLNLTCLNISYSMNPQTEAAPRLLGQNNSVSLNPSADAESVVLEKLVKAIQNKDPDQISSLRPITPSVINAFYNKLAPLHYAAIAGNQQIFQMLLDAGASLTITDVRKNTVLHFAARYASPEFVSYVYDLAPSLGTATAMHGETPLHEACKKDAVDMVKVLLDKNVLLMREEHGTAQPIYHAARHGSLLVLQYFATHHSKYFKEKLQALIGESPRAYSPIAAEVKDAAMHFLVKQLPPTAKIRPCAFDNLFRYAIKFNHHFWLKRLAIYNAERQLLKYQNAQIRPWMDNEILAFSIANNGASAQYLLKQIPSLFTVLLNHESHTGRQISYNFNLSPLVFAAQYGQLDIVKFIAEDAEKNPASSSVVDWNRPGKVLLTAAIKGGVVPVFHFIRERIIQQTHRQVALELVNSLVPLIFQSGASQLLDELVAIKYLDINKLGTNKFRFPIHDNSFNWLISKLNILPKHLGLGLLGNLLENNNKYTADGKEKQSRRKDIHNLIDTHVKLMEKEKKEEEEEEEELDQLNFHELPFYTFATTQTRSPLLVSAPPHVASTQMLFVEGEPLTPLSIKEPEPKAPPAQGIKRKQPSSTTPQVKKAVPHVKNALLTKKNGALTIPESNVKSKKARITDATIIRLKKISTLSPTMAQTSNEFPVSTRDFGANFEGVYFTLSDSLPKRDERVTMLLAKRMTKAFIPSERHGGRVVMIISDDEKENIPSLLNKYVDVFVINEMDFHHRALSKEQLGLFTARRLAAFLLARCLGQKTVAVLDDNIKEIHISAALSKNSTLSDWPTLFAYIANITMQSYRSVGFKERSHLNPGLDPKSNASRGLTIIDQGPDGDNYAFGQKIFFYNIENIDFAGLNGASNLLPPDIRLPQEDSFIQMVLAKSNHKVGYVDRNSITFIRKQGKSHASSRAKRSEEWFSFELEKIAHYYSLDSKAKILSVLQETVEATQDYVRKVVLKNLQDKDIVKATPLSTLCANVAQGSLPASEGKGKEREKVPSDNAPTEVAHQVKDCGPDALVQYLDEILNEQQKKEAKRSLAENVNRYLSVVRYGELDPSSELAKLPPLNELEIAAHSWLTFRNRLIGSYWDKETAPYSFQSLYPFQRDALYDLGRFLGKIRETNAGFFDSATGSGKTEFILRIVELASKTLKGNIAIVMPSLDLEDQNYQRVLQFAESRKALQGEANAMHLANVSAVSSQKNHASAKLAALNIPLSNGGNLSLFCEKSFIKFIKKKRGDLSAFSLLLFDEMHKVSSFTQEFIQRAKRLPTGIILGFSATPRKHLNLFGGEEGRIFTYDSKTAVQEGYLAPWDTMVAPIKKHHHHLQFAQEFLNFLSTTEHQNKKLTEQQGIIYTKFSPGELDEIASFLTKNGIESRGFHYKTPNRPEVLEAFKRGEIKVLLAIKTLREGFDAPVKYIYIVNSKYSDDDLIQMRGRALRLNYPEKCALILVADEEQRRKLSMDN